MFLLLLHFREGNEATEAYANCSKPQRCSDELRKQSASETSYGAQKLSHKNLQCNKRLKDK